MNQSGYSNVTKQKWYNRSVIKNKIETYRSISRADLIDYITTHYKGPRIVLAGAGGVNHETLVKMAEDNFKSLGGSYVGDAPEVAPCRFTGIDFFVLYSWSVLLYETYFSRVFKYLGIPMGKPLHIIDTKYSS